MILIDANVLIDVAMDDPIWADWSQQQLDHIADMDMPAINDVVYAELSVRYDHMADLDAMLAQFQIGVASTPREALFIAGKAYRRYRASGGIRTGVLPDFFIGAHAFAAGIRLVTRDAARYRTYFPGIRLIAPS